MGSTRTTTDDAEPRFFTGLVVCGFVMTIVWLDRLATEVVALIEAAGFLSGVSTSLLGLTVIAIGNSTGDLVANMAVARGAEGSDSKQGSKMALAACFGSPLLMNLIGAGASLLAHMAITSGNPVQASISQNCRLAYLFLFVALASHLVGFPLSNYSPSRRYAIYLFCLYGLFVLLAIMAEAGLLGAFLM